MSAPVIWDTPFARTWLILLGRTWLVGALLCLVILLTRSFLIAPLLWALAHGFVAYRTAQMVGDRQPSGLLRLAALILGALGLALVGVYAMQLFMLQFLAAGPLISIFVATVLAGTWLAPRALASLLSAEWTPHALWPTRLWPHAIGGAAILAIVAVNVAVSQNPDRAQAASNILIGGTVALSLYGLLVAPVLCFAAAITGGRFVPRNKKAVEPAFAAPEEEC